MNDSYRLLRIFNMAAVKFEERMTVLRNFLFIMNLHFLLKYNDNSILELI